MPDKIVEWSVAVQTRKGEEVSGDHYLICRVSNRVLVAVVDGIGHGPEAALASRTAMKALEANADQSLVALFSICHKALHDTRGAVISVAAFDGLTNSLAWLGVGNVEGRLLRADRSATRPEEELLKYGGVVGHEMSAVLIIGVLPVAKDDVLILATDGIRPDFAYDLKIGKSAHNIAHDILAKYNKGTDDALVMVAKYRGGVPLQK
jgi:serine phosphatase RsbU (regulator of sigma subunit)